MNDFLSLYGYEEFLNLFEVVFDVFGTFTLLGGIFAVILYVVKGISMFTICNNCGIKNGWLSFIPFANIFIFGKIAEMYVRKDGKKSAKYSILLPILAVLKYVAVIILAVIFLISIITIISNVELAVEVDSELTISMFSSFISVIVAYFITLAITVAYLIYYYIALWRIYTTFNKNNSTLYTVLSVFFDFLTPIFMYVIRNNNPNFETESKVGYFETEGEI